MSEEIMRPGIEPRGNGRQGQDWALVVYQIGGKVYSVEGPIMRVDIENIIDSVWDFSTLADALPIHRALHIEFNGDVSILAKDLQR